MASKALIHLGMFFAGHLHRNHLEMSHIVTGGGLMALRTFHRARGRMTIFRNTPLHRRMTGYAIDAEYLAVGILIRMASRAIEGRFERM